MATLITKNSSTASAVPAAGDLVKGELAVNVTDKKVYTKDNSAAVVKLVGSLGNQEANAVAVTGGTINGTTIGATTPSTGAFTTASASSGFTGNLTGNVTGNVSGTAANVTGVVAIANGGTGLSALGTGVQTALGQNVTGSGGIVLATSPSLTTPNLGTPSAAVLTNATGLPLTTGVTGTLGVANGGTGITAFGTGVATALGQNVTGSGGIVLATSPSLTTPNLGTPSAATLTNATGLPISTGVSGLGTGVATALAVNTGSAGAFVVNGGALGTPSSGTLTNATGLPISTGVSGLGTGVATALAVNTGSAGAFVVNGGALGTPSSGTVTNLTGTASININGTVGATTPTTGAFTTLSASGNITVSGGTANGVAYLNGSKVLTTGSALTFDGTNFTSSGIITSTNANGVRAQYPSSASYYAQLDARDGNTYLSAVGPTAAIVFRATDNTSTTAEGMRLTSTGLGIGTSSPAVKLQSNVSRTSGQNVTALVLSDTVTGAQTSGFGTQIQGWSNNGSAQSAIGFEAYGGTNNDTALGFYTQASAGGLTRRMTISSTGDVGIGTGSPSAKLHVVGNQFRQNDATNSQGYTINTTSATTTLVTLFGGSSFAIQTGGSGTNQLLLDASGNLGLGVTPTIIVGASGVNGKGLQGDSWTISSYAGTDQTYLATNAYTSAYVGGWKYRVTAAATRYDQSSGIHAWYTAPSGTAGNAISFTQAMTLDASGRLGIGATSPGTNLHIGTGSSPENLGVTLSRGSTTNFYLAHDGTKTFIAGIDPANDGPKIGSLNSYPFLFVTGNTERARITSGGDLLVGKTATDTTIVGAEIRPTSASGYIAAFTSDAQRAVIANRLTSDGDLYSMRRSGTEVGTISVTTTATAYNTSSDYRLKDNPQPLTSSGAFIDALKPKTWNWKSDGSKGVGFIAHEVQEVSPGSVVGTKDAVDAEGKPVYQAMEYGSAEFIANIIAELQSLRARVAQLEAK